MTFRQKYEIKLEFFTEDTSSFKTIEEIAISSAQELFAAALLVSAGARLPNVEILISHGTRSRRIIDKNGIEVE